MAEAADMPISASEAAPAAADVKSFAKDDVVWAKIFGFPWWPARVTNNVLPAWVDDAGKYRVRFFFTAERITLATSSLIAHATRPDLADAEKIKKPALRKQFLSALAELADEPRKDAESDWPDPPRPAEQEEGWLDAGHFYIGERVARNFDLGGGLSKIVVGTISRWLPAATDPATGESEPPLFHVSHDDGDEEDLEEYEVAEAMAMYEATPEAQKLAAKKAKEEVGLHHRLRSRPILRPWPTSYLSARPSAPRPRPSGLAAALGPGRSPRLRRRCI